jgi:simple sugar transport system ATP-binding protein
MTEAVLEMRNITKVYPNGVVANRDVNFSLVEGEIHALAGENGAGKSTLMKILFGMEDPSEGEIYLRGEKIRFHSPQNAIAAGIGMVHQHFMLVPSFTVAENMILGMEPKKGVMLNLREAVRITEECAKKYNLHVDPLAKVEHLSVGMKQKVEILKALVRGARILVLDEPTAVLTPQETAELFEELKMLKQNGHTIVFISHKLKEVKAICDRITIMRSGRTEGVFAIDEVSEQDITRLMVGRDVVLKYEKDERTYGRPVLRVNGLTVTGAQSKPDLNNVRFSVREGEILGVAGVEGNGQSQLVEAIMGRTAGVSGAVEVDGMEITRLDIERIRSRGVAYIPEDRMRQGAAGSASILDNLVSTRYKQNDWNVGPLLNRKKMWKLSESLIEAFKVKASGPAQPIGMLSGGNMQKVVVARESDANPRVLIAEQPTRGVDVGAAQIIHRKMLDLRRDGCAILLLSADLNEVLELSDTLIVMYEGEIVAYFENPSELSEQQLGLYMLGMKRQDAEQIGRAYHV